jgi:hypothetical protein
MMPAAMVPAAMMTMKTAVVTAVEAAVMTMEARVATATAWMRTKTSTCRCHAHAGNCSKRSNENFVDLHVFTSFFFLGLSQG